MKASLAIDLDDLMDELNRGRVYECSLHDPFFHLDGLQQGEQVFVDPRPAVLETVLHELLHRRKPRWGERRVRQESGTAMPEQWRTVSSWWFSLLTDCSAG